MRIGQTIFWLTTTFLLWCPTFDSLAQSQESSFQEINKSVGKNGVNALVDVKNIQGALNAD